MLVLSSPSRDLVTPLPLHRLFFQVPPLLWPGIIIPCPFPSLLLISLPFLCVGHKLSSEFTADLLGGVSAQH